MICYISRISADWSKFTMARKGGLGGKGLGALISGADTVKKQSFSGDSGVLEMEIDKVSPNKEQPRKNFDEEKLADLAESIKIHGIVSPLIVVNKGDYYMIIAGERRYRAARKAKLKTVPVIVKDYDEIKSEEIALVENLQRENLNPVEEASGYKKLMDSYGLTQEQVSERVSKSRPQIANMLRLLSLPKSVLKYLEDGSLSTGHAKVLAGLDSKKSESLAEITVSKKLSVRQLEALLHESPVKRNKKSKISPDIENAINDTKDKLTKKYSTNVKIDFSDKFKGKITLSFSGLEDMTRILDLLER